MDFPSPEEFVEGQLLCIDKPLEWTSFQVVNFIRGRLRRYTGLKKIKVGHAGTLDPLASGLLLICTGRKTKKIEEYMGLPKVYTGTLQIGAATPSHDLETEIDQQFPIEHLNLSDIENEMAKLTGEIQQVPPIFSAIKKDGERLYEKARKGETSETEIPSRQVLVEKFECTNFQENGQVSFRVECSKGTYIRSLARDLGRGLNNGAHLTSLRREAIGDFNVSEAIEPKAWASFMPKKEKPADQGL